jgi:hypothetical protein
MSFINKLLDTLISRRVKKSAGLTSYSRRPIPPAVACWDCSVIQRLHPQRTKAMEIAEHFFHAHEGHAANWYERPYTAGLWTPNADIKVALQAAQSFTVTNLNSMNGSTTTGWQSAVVDNTSNLFLDAHVFPTFSFFNGAASEGQVVLIQAYGGLESGVYTYPASGSQGSITVVDYRDGTPKNLPHLGSVWFQQNTVVSAGPFSVATGFRGELPPYWGIIVFAYVRLTSQVFNSSGNSIKYRGQYLTCV